MSIFEGIVTANPDFGFVPKVHDPPLDRRVIKAGIEKASGRSRRPSVGRNACGRYAMPSEGPTHVDPTPLRGVVEVI
jgi:hypothetical protein